MLEEKLLKILIREIIEEENVKLRTAKAGGASHPIVNRSPSKMMGFGKSDIRYEDEKLDKIKEKSKTKNKSVAVSRAFAEDNDESNEDYQRVLEELLNAN